MLTSKKLELRRSEIRQSLAELSNAESLTDETRSKIDDLDREYQDAERQYRAALISEDEQRQEAKGELETRSDTEFAEMMAGFEMRQVALALDEGRALDGQTAEIVQELRSAGGYRGIPVPWQALEQRAGETVASGTPDPISTRPVRGPRPVQARLGAEVAPDDLPERDGPVVLGVDLGGSRSMSAAALFWPNTGRLEAVGAFPANPSLADRGQADGVSNRYVEMAERGELVTMGDTTVPVDRFIAAVADRLDGQSIAAIVGDRFRHAEFLEALRGAGLDRVPGVWRGMGWRDGSEDVERFRRGLFEGRVASVPSLLLRSAFADAITLIDPAGNHKLVKGRSTGRIDAAAASVLAVAQGMRMVGAPKGGGGRIAWG